MEDIYSTQKILLRRGSTLDEENIEKYSLNYLFLRSYPQNSHSGLSFDLSCHPPGTIDHFQGYWDSKMYEKQEVQRAEAIITDVLQNRIELLPVTQTGINPLSLPLGGLYEFESERSNPERYDNISEGDHDDKLTRDKQGGEIFRFSEAHNQFHGHDSGSVKETRTHKSIVLDVLGTDEREDFDVDSFYENFTEDPMSNQEKELREINRLEIKGASPAATDQCFKEETHTGTISGAKRLRKKSIHSVSDQGLDLNLADKNASISTKIILSLNEVQQTGDKRLGKRTDRKDYSIYKNMRVSKPLPNPSPVQEKTHTGNPRGRPRKYPLPEVSPKMEKSEDMIALTKETLKFELDSSRKTLTLQDKVMSVKKEICSAMREGQLSQASFETKLHMHKDQTREEQIYQNESSLSQKNSHIQKCSLHLDNFEENQGIRLEEDKDQSLKDYSIYSEEIHLLFRKQLSPLRKYSSVQLDQHPINMMNEEEEENLEDETTQNKNRPSENENDLLPDVVEAVTIDKSRITLDPSSTDGQALIKRKRGRPRKYPRPEEISAVTSVTNVNQMEEGELQKHTMSSTGKKILREGSAVEEQREIEIKKISGKKLKLNEVARNQLTN